MPVISIEPLTERLQVRLWWIHDWNLPPEWKWLGPLHRPFTTVWYVLEGVIGARQGTTTFEIKQNELAIVPPGSQLFSWNAGPANLRYLSLGCELQLDGIDLFFGSDIGIYPVCLSAEVIDLWRRLEKTADLCLNDGNEWHWLTLSGLVRLWWAQIGLAINRDILSTGKKLHPGLADALQYMRENLCENLTTQNVADHVHMSSGYLRQLIHDQLRSSFRRILAEMRMNKAKSLLLGTDSTISEIARQVGYRDVHHFSRAFSRYTLSSPSQYRAEPRHDYIEAGR